MQNIAGTVMTDVKLPAAVGIEETVSQAEQAGTPFLC